MWRCRGKSDVKTVPNAGYSKKTATRRNRLRLPHCAARDPVFANILFHKPVAVRRRHAW